MIQSIQDEDAEGFLRHWSERVYDQIQLAQIAAIEEKLTAYAMTAWRPMNIPPPVDTLLICACDDGLMLLRLTQMGDWRSSGGVPQRPPRAWMPAPLPPQLNGRGR